LGKKKERKGKRFIISLTTTRGEGTDSYSIHPRSVLQKEGVKEGEGVLRTRAPFNTKEESKRRVMGGEGGERGRRKQDVSTRCASTTKRRKKTFCLARPPMKIRDLFLGESDFDLVRFLDMGEREEGMRRGKKKGVPILRLAVPEHKKGRNHEA